ncbi:MAG TPA: RidA family protein [Candidatus Sulfotelmatobacter sp.]|nr:RidA family protein [Candidatus Sulfotelmatobacter sp.]
MPRRHIEGTWQKQRAFSPAVVTEGGTTIWLAGHGATHDDAGASLAGDFDAQVRQSFKNIERSLAAAGGRLTDIVTMTVYIVDVRHGDRFIELRKQHFPDGNYPASALITVTGFARPEMLVEIMPIAVVGDR